MPEPVPPSRHRILLIDDNPSIHADFRKILGGSTAQESSLATATAALFGEPVPASASSSFEIASAMQGQEGIDMVQQAVEEGRPYALAFIDVRMPPGMDGIETTAKIWETYPDLQVVICTAYSDYSWDEMIEKIGGSDRLLILKKPFDTVEALQLAHTLTAKWHLAQQLRTQIGDLERLVVDLHKSEAQFRVIAENAADLISIVDARGAFTYYSPSYEKVLGFAPAALARKSVAAHIHPEDQFKVILIAEYAFETGVGQFLEYRMRHLDGSWRAFEAHADPVRNAHGQIEHLVLVARDITQLRRVEAQLHHVQKMESIGQLAAGIAHEINTPTQYIGDNTRFLQEAFADIHRLLGDYDRLYHAAAAGTVPPELLIAVESSVATADVGYLSEEIPKAIEQSLQGVQRVSKIVGSMKEFSHPGTDEKVAIDLNQSIESTLTVATNEWRYVANMVTDFDRTLPQVHCLPGEFNQVVLNIVVNACHAIADVPGDGSGGKGTITVSTRRRGDWVEVRICDTGAGIPEDIRHKIFDPFFTTKGVGKGTGQGLAIAHAVMVNKHGGVIEVESEVGKGTTFIIRMPINPATEKKAA